MSKIVFYEVLIIRVIKFIKKQNCLQGPDTNIEFNTQTADVSSNAQSLVYIWKSSLALFRYFTCCLGVYIDCVLIKITFNFFSVDTYTD